MPQCQDCKTQIPQWEDRCDGCWSKFHAEGRCTHAGGGFKTTCFTCNHPHQSLFSVNPNTASAPTMPPLGQTFCFTGGGNRPPFTVPNTPGHYPPFIPVTMPRPETPKKELTETVSYCVPQPAPKKEFTEEGEEKRVFATGAQRGWAEGNGRFDLIPYAALLSMARRFELGVRKYGANNYKKGMPLGESYLNSAYRHLGKLAAGWTDEDHAGAVMFNIAAFIETQELIKQGKLPAELDDLPKT